MALVHFQAAADRGYGLSQLAVADFYAYGVTGPPKVDLAMRYARLALSYDEKSALNKINEYQKILTGDSSNVASIVQVDAPSSSSPLKEEPNPPVPIPEYQILRRALKSQDYLLLTPPITLLKILNQLYLL